MKLQALTSAVLCGALAVSLLAGCAAKQPASAAAQSTGQKSHLTIMGTEGWAPCDNWDEIGEYSAFQILNGWLNEADLDITWQVIDTAQYPDALRTLLASGKELPDIIKVHTLDDSLLLSLAEQGLILPLNDIIALTSRSAVNTSPCAATRSFDLTCFFSIRRSFLKRTWRSLQNRTFS